MRNKMKWMAVLAIVPMAMACGSSDDDKSDDKKTTDAGATDGGADDDGGAVADGAGATDAGGGATDAGGSGKMQTCTEVGDCVIKACAPKGFAKGCSDACLAEDAVELSALQKAAPALGCMQDVCLATECTNTATDEPDCLDDCMNERCLGPVLACLDDGKTGDQLCPSISGCMDNCSILKPEPFKCMNACVNTLDAKAKAQLNALTKCMAENKGDMDKCFGEVATCMTAGKTGDKPCGYLMQCMDGCDEKDGDDGACTFKCLAELTAEGQALFGKMLEADCMGDDEGGDEGGPQGECGKLVFECAIQGQSGDLKCHEVFGCAEKCAADMVKDGKKPDQGACFMMCAGKLSKAAQPAFLEAAACFGKEGDAKCDAAMMTCIAPSGTANCAATATCISKCPPSQGDDGPGSCMYECLHAAKDAATAGTLMTAVGKCENGPTPDCVAAALVCGAAAGKGTCASVLQCMETCMGKDGDGNGLFCAISCLPDAEPKAADAFAALMTCQSTCENDCEGKPDSKACEDTCMGTKCKDQVAACPVPK